VSDKVVWRPNPGPQTEFLACPAREVLYAGSVGSGKSDALLMGAVSQSGNPRHRALLLRRTFPMLRDLIGRSHELFLPLGAVYRKQESAWTFPSGAIVEFGFCDAPGDEYRYMGRQFSFIGFDELTTWPGDVTDPQGQPCSSAYLYLLTRLRAVEGSGLRLEVRATCTPNGVGSTWVKTRWQIPDSGSASEVLDPATGYRRVFIPARISDNPYLAGTQYERSLAALPEATRKALLEGRWDCFEGAVFSEWNYHVHTIDPFPIPHSWVLWRGADDGYANPACVLWFAHDSIYDRIYVIQELYERGLTPQAMAASVLALDKQIPLSFPIPLSSRNEIALNNAPMKGTIDAASFADTGLGGGRANVMNSLGCNWRPSEKGPGSRLAGIAAIHSRLALGDDGKARLIVFRTCRNLIRTLPALPYSTRHPEDGAEGFEDHAVEALRIGLTANFWTFRRVRVWD
jgi:hypothetical protein